MVEKTKRILVPIGFSEQSLVALDQAVIVAKDIGAEIVLISVAETNSFWQKLFNNEHDVDALKKEALKKLKVLIEDRSDSGVHMEPMVARGIVHEEIARAADMLSPEIIIMGTNGRPDNFNRKMVGSNAFRVVKHVTDPVITLKGSRGFTEVNTIVFPVLLGRKSKEKVGECLHWARIFGSQVKVVAAARDLGEFKKLTPHVSQVVEFIEKHGVVASSEIIETKGRTLPISVLEYCEDVNADLLIIMDDDVDSVLHVLGNEVEDVLYNAEIPVMCVTPKPSKYSAGFQSF